MTVREVREWLEGLPKDYQDAEFMAQVGPCSSSMRQITAGENEMRDKVVMAKPAGLLEQFTVLPVRHQFVLYPK